MTRHSVTADSLPGEKMNAMHKEFETTHEVAERGHAATDIHGNSLIEFDPEAEKRLRRKMDWYIVPTVALLYLFCFIDRANIGTYEIMVCSTIPELTSR